MKNFIKKLSVFDIIICILFIVVNILSIILFGWLGLIAIPILSLLIFVYFYPNKIVILFKNIKKILFTKRKDNSFSRKKNKDNNNEEKKINFKKKMKNYSVEEEFDESDILLEEEEEKEELFASLYETRDVDIVKKINNKKKNKDNKKNNSKNNKKNVIVSKNSKNSKKSKSNSNNMKVRNKEKKNKRKFWKILVSMFLIFCIACVLGVAAFLTYIVVTTEDFDPNKLTYQDQTKVYDKNGNVFATLGTEKRESVTYDKLPQVLIDAIIATEDSRFFEHNGVDFARFLKASLGQLMGQSNAGGASTLTMQVSKNNLTSRDSDGLEGIIRKFRDVYISVFQIEKKYSKEQIIEFYVNDNLLGGSNYGVEQASRYYFDKSVSELNLSEAATIAGIFQSPNKYRPDRYPEEAETRRNLVLDLMVRHGYITKDEAEIAKAISVESLIVAKAEENNYQAFLDTVTSEVESKTKLNPYEVSMEIYTSLDTSIQKGIDDIMSGKTYTWENDLVQSGIAVIKVDTGEVVAIGAGRNRKGTATWNNATQARRHPGSTAKPIFDYGPGFEYSNYSTYTLFNDEPWSYTNGPSIKNHDAKFLGLMTLKKAISISRNVPALKAFQENNKNDIYNFVTSLGIKPEDPLHESHAIGGFTGVTPLELAAAYACFANGGYRIEPHTVTKIVYRDTGEVEEFKYTKERVMKASTAFLVNNILEYSVDYGFTGGARVSGKTTAAKTGTSSFDSVTLKANNLPANAVNDLWTAAYTPEYSFSVWYGYTEINSEYYNVSADGSKYKDKIVKELVKVIPMTSKEFDVPDTVVKSQVEFGTWPAQLPSEYTPSDLITTEYFVKGTQPTEVSDRFAKLNDVTNLKTEKVNNNTVKLTWDYKTPNAFDENYLRTYFSQRVFGNGTDTFISERLNYAGGIGFGIYTRDEDGNLKRIKFTTDKEYEYTNTTNKDIQLVVKVQYAQYDANASDGVVSEVIPSGKNNPGIDIGDNNSSSLTVSGIGSKNIPHGTYKESIIVKDNNRDVTDLATIEYSIASAQIYTSDKKVFESKVNLLTKGTYEIKYKIIYDGKTIIKNRTLYIDL